MAQVKDALKGRCVGVTIRVIGKVAETPVTVAEIERTAGAGAQQMATTRTRLREWGMSVSWDYNFEVKKLRILADICSTYSGTK